MLVSFLVATNSLVERWRETGPVLWVIAGAAAGLWIVLLVVLAMRSEPRRVAAGPATLDPGGPEPPAVVNLLTNDWELSRQSVPATLLDLAARRFVTIEWIGARTLVRVREHRTGDDPLSDYERLVLEHVRSLSQETADGFVPADALTTGPDAMAAIWWRRFEHGVIDDARARGLSRARWGSGARTILTAAALAVGVFVGIASTTLTSDKQDDDPIGAALGLGFMSAAVLIAATAKLGGERDTIDGRRAAARWLGMRTMLANDPTFATQPPAAVTIWDRMMSYGAALGVARVAVETLPLGAESERRAWSPVGNRWRVVKIRYPRRFPPGYGRHPAIVALLGLVATGAGVFIAPGAVSVSHSLLSGIGDLANDHTVPVGVRVFVGVAVAVVVTVGALLAVWGAGMLIGGIGDLVRPRRSVEGRVLRVRERGDDEHRFWHLAVDDGTADRVRAWRLSSAPGAHQGAIVRARVSPWLGHVADLSTVRENEPTVVASVPAPVDVPTTADPPPALPDAAIVATALGVAVRDAPSAVPYPLAIDGATRTFVTEDGGRIITAWIQPAALDELRHLPSSIATPIGGVGEEAFRAPMGGGLVVRVDGHVLLVAATLPAFDAEARDRAVMAVAHAVATNVA